jgi:nitrite reductase/ring-hydroxylating ferredoxin subunit
MGDDFREAACLDDLPEGAIRMVAVGSDQVLLVRCEGTVHAVGAVCTHGMAYLEDGELDGFELVCPLHGGAFDVRDGSPSRGPCIKALVTFSVQVVKSAVYVGPPLGAANGR